MKIPVPRNAFDKDEQAIEACAASSSNNWATSFFLFAFLAGIYTAILWTVPPAGDFPLNDDWVYTKSVCQLLSEGTYRGHPYMLANPILHVYMGALISQIWGGGFEQLRMWALVLGLITAWVAAECGKTCGLRFWGCLLIGLVVLLNPINLNLSYTFMTDGPFVFFSCLSGYFFLRGIRFNTTRSVLAGSFFAGAAYMIRQFGVLMVLAYVATEVCLYLRRRRSFPWQRLFSSLAPASVLFFLTLYLSRHREIGTSLPFQLDIISFIPRAGYLFVVSVSYLAFFCIPVVAVVAIERFSAPSKERHRFLKRSLVTLAAMLPFLFWHGLQRLPTFLPNMIYDFGVGPITMLREGDPWQGPIHIGRLWWPVTLVWMAMGAVVMLLMFESAWALFTRREEPDAETPTGLFLVLWAATIILGLANPWTIGHINIRYIMPALIPVALLSAHAAPSPIRKSSICTAIAFTVLLGVLSVVFIQDYFAWQRARWQAVACLTEELEIPLEQISGGFEVNGWYHSDQFMEIHDTRDFTFRGPYGFYALDDTYIVTLAKARDGYDHFLDVPYFSWLGMETRHIRVLKRKTLSGSD